MSQSNVTISTAEQLHNYLIANCQFDFNPNHARDAPLYAAIKQALQLPAGKFIVELRARNVTAEAYLRALMDAAQPLAEMYRQILAYCSRAHFLSSKNSAAIEFQLTSGGPTIGFSYEDFRRYDEIRASLTPSMDAMRRTKNDVMDWLAHAVFEHEHASFAQTPFDWTEIGIFSILTQARDKYSAAYPGIFAGLNRHYLNVDEEGQPVPPQLKTRVINHVAYQKHHAAVAKHFPLDAIELIASKFIELPFWKFRWQVYEIWVLVVTLSEFQPLGFQLVSNHDGQSLIEQGRAATLATHVDGHHTALYQPTYQNRNDEEIRPDIVISQSSKATPDDVPLIVECKQRLNLDTTHINEVAKKYAAGTTVSTGQVVIVNYDDAPAWSNAAAQQTVLIGNVRPGSAGEEDLRRTLRASTVAKALRKEVWFIDVSLSMGDSLDDDFRQFLATRAAVCATGAFQLYGFAEQITSIEPSEVRATVAMSNSSDDENWEGNIMQALKAKIDDYLGNKGYRVFVVSDVDEAIAATFQDRGVHNARLDWIDPSSTPLRDVIDAQSF
ncbi:hypothetical protein LXM60_07865 [Pandoraea sputorum]|uniref:hypothetical protein n=1 Tax=Pandoraea sputorum TaxID=93222 RepID=UPI001E412621|nr:hypothetical protein [Pandoraea sputorum]MCE4060115.1 hypothetical protein [Pandoraea sputorum]